MSIKSQALDLHNFLQHTSSMWSEEIMNEYPKSIENYSEEWIDLLDKLTPLELYAIDCKKIIPAIEGTSFEKFMKEVQRLSELPSIPNFNEIPLEDWAFQGVKKKKRHEIQTLVPVINNLKKDFPFEHVVDIGGGVGHLSRVLAHYHGIPSYSLDRNSEFQKIGLERLSKYRKIEGAREVKFITIDFGNDNEKDNQAELSGVFTDKSLALGLHTCGNLANTLIQKSIDNKMGLLSFGCCYLNLNPEKDFPLSKFYQEEKYSKLNLFALTLATRSHVEMDFCDYQTKERVKNYRYALHLFLMKYFKRGDLTGVGECHIRVYSEPFANYIKVKLHELKIDHQFSDRDFNAFYDDPLLQRELRVMFLCNIIRWQIGRVLEIYLLLDRCLYLEENGFAVRMEKYFEEKISPRNIGILAIKS